MARTVYPTSTCCALLLATIVCRERRRTLYREEESEAGCSSDGHYCPLVDTAENRTPGPGIPSRDFATPSFNSGARGSGGGWAIGLRRDLPRQANSASCSFQRRVGRGHPGPWLRRRANPNDWRLGDRLKSRGRLGNCCPVDARQRKAGRLHAGLCTRRANHDLTPPQDRIAVQAGFFFQPICQTFENHFAVIVALNSPYKDLSGLIEAAKQQPGNFRGEMSAPPQYQICKCTA